MIQLENITIEVNQRQTNQQTISNIMEYLYDNIDTGIGS